MIHSMDVRNFRCYRHLKVDGCSRLNVIVGDNGSGKTAILESIFLPLATGSEVAVRLRQLRGIDSTLGGSMRRIEEALWGDFFYNNDMTQKISLVMSGDGRDSRSLEISRGSGGTELPLESGQELLGQVAAAPVVFTWTDHNKNSHIVTPKISQSGLNLPETGEDMPDFFFFSANQTVGSIENASRFSELSKANKQETFIRIFSNEYDWIENLNVEVHAGAPIIFASIRGSKRKLPLPNISSGINRITGIMLAIASRKKSVVLVDEIENGIYYRHLGELWRSIITSIREFDGQMFVSTHSKECLTALVEAAGNDTKDISLWRTEKDGSEATVKQFSGEDFKAGIEYGEEVR